MRWLPDSGSLARSSTSDRLVPWVLLPGLIALLAEPCLWLWRTWSDPSYASDGAFVALAVAGLIVVSAASGPASPDPRARRHAWWLFAGTALLRAAGRLLDVGTLGALALVVDVAALALWLGLSRRPWSVRPAALAALFALALPVEHLLQRLAGHPLQLLAARLSEMLLMPAFPSLSRVGSILTHPGVELAVDLPCSGARGLVLLSGTALLFLCRRRVGARDGLRMAVAASLGAIVANTLRVAGLFVGAASDLPVADEPWHTALGTACLALGATPLLRIAQRLPTLAPRHARIAFAAAPRFPFRWPAALAVSAVGIAVASTPHSPVDVSHAEPGRSLPEELGGFSGATVPLRDVERRYYRRYGGQVEKRVYDDGADAPHTVLRVRTDSPLRHLHGPDRCLIGEGHRVTREGVRLDPVPTVVYRSVAPDGRVWRVEASFLSDDGGTAASVSDVVWRWIGRPKVAWNLVERISPWRRCEVQPERCERFDGALFAALDLRGA